MTDPGYDVDTIDSYADEGAASDSAYADDTSDDDTYADDASASDSTSSDDTYADFADEDTSSGRTDSDLSDTAMEETPWTDDGPVSYDDTASTDQGAVDPSPIEAQPTASDQADGAWQSAATSSAPVTDGFMATPWSRDDAAHPDAGVPADIESTGNGAAPLQLPDGGALPMPSALELMMMPHSYQGDTISAAPPLGHAHHDAAERPENPHTPEPDYSTESAKDANQSGYHWPPSKDWLDKAEKDLEDWWNSPSKDPEPDPNEPEPEPIEPIEVIGD